jgi:UDP-N-acetylmuramyl tripeptide synthase
MDYQGNCLVLDYAHNIDGYEKSLSALVKLKSKTRKKNLIGLVALAADRQDSVRENVAETLGKVFDEIFVRSIKNNDNTKKLLNLLEKKKSKVSKWTKSYSEFIQSKSNNNNIVYLTIAGHGHISDLKETVSKLKIL